MMQASCPSCGGEMKFVSKSTLYAACPYCSSLILRKDLDVELVGKLGQLQDDGTPVQLGTRGRYRGRGFQVIGRIQYRFGAGFWNEWYLDIDGWLGETQGMYAVLFRVQPAERIPKYFELSVGATVTIAGKPYDVKEKQASHCVGGEGELPFAIESDYEAPVADLVGPDARFATIDYSEEPPLVFAGEYVEFDQLEFTNLRQVPGW
jgi:DNA-directed RNA polymerase subunit RPC12/RpoP